MIDRHDDIDITIDIAADRKQQIDNNRAIYRMKNRKWQTEWWIDKMTDIIADRQNDRQI